MTTNLNDRSGFFRRSFLKVTLAVTFAAASCGLNTFAKGGSVAISGTVQDATGAVIAGAAVHVVNQGKGQAFDTKSNSNGFYSVPSLFTGNYTLTFSFPGMKRYQTSISLQVAQTAIISPALTIGSIIE